MARFAMAISLNQLLIHSRNTVQVCQRIHVLLASSTHRYTLCGKSVARAWSDPGPILWTSSVMLTKWPPLTRTEELEPAFTRQNIAEWAINVLKYHLHANTGTTHSSRPGQRELLISRIHYSCTATLHWLLLQPAGKYLMRRIKIFHINYIPVAGGLGGVSWTVAWC